MNPPYIVCGQTAVFCGIFAPHKPKRFSGVILTYWACEDCAHDHAKVENAIRQAVKERTN